MAYGLSLEEQSFQMKLSDLMVKKQLVRNKLISEISQNKQPKMENALE